LRRNDNAGESENIKLIVFDLDGVLVDTNSNCQTVHEAFGVNNEEKFSKIPPK